MILRHPLRSRASGLALPLRRFLSLKTAVSYCAKPADDGPTYKRLKKAVGPSAGLSWAAEQFKRWPAFTKDAGEDMFLNETTESGTLLAVSDGVGGWKLDGIDSSVFSKSLCFYLGKHYTKHGLEQNASTPLVHLLEQAHRSVLADASVAAGSATTCLVHLNPHTNTLQALNLGDSAFVQIRENRIIHWQPAQQHYFNCPKQLVKWPEMKVPSGIQEDLPVHGDAISLDIKDGDCIVVISDGVTDNVFPKEMLALQSVFLSPAEKSEHGEEMALRRFTSALVSLTWQLQRDTKRRSPFTVEAEKSRLEGDVLGGKVDDIAIATAIVTA